MYRTSKYNEQLGVAGLLARDELTVQQAHGRKLLRHMALHETVIYLVWLLPVEGNHSEDEIQ